LGYEPVGAEHGVTGVRVTHIGGPTMLIQDEGWSLLTDPMFDDPGRRYAFGWGTSSRKMAGPAVAAADLPPIDAVLLTHDHDGDNLDAAGRALLPSAGVVVTTVSGAKRLGVARVGCLRGTPSGLRRLGEHRSKSRRRRVATARP
jgi:L-ascorbate metabolism protein UlaG (beta-lactamase superfamily)